VFSECFLVRTRVAHLRDSGQSKFDDREMLYILQVHTEPIDNNYYFQIQYLMKYFQGHVQLPPEDERWAALESLEEEWNSKNIAVRHRPKMGTIGEDVYPYLVSLASQGGIPEITANLELKRIGLMINVTRLFVHTDIFRNDRFRWIDSKSATYLCYADPRGESQEELLTLSLDKSTGKVNITSSLGEIQNRPFVS